MRASDLITLTKPKVSALVIITGLTGFFMAAPHSVDLLKAALFVALSYLVVGGCGACNMYLDRDVDCKMPRTANRPVPSGRVRPSTALTIGAIMISSGVALAYVLFNPMTSLFMLLGVIVYVFVYSIWLKRRTPWNIVIGGAAGGFAPLGGWAAVTGDVGAPALLLALLIFLWTPGHFWGLAIRAREQYSRARIPMLPVVTDLERAAKLTSLSNLPVVPATLVFLFYGGQAALLIAVLLAGGLFLYENLKLYLSPSVEKAWRVFKTSSPYLFIICLALIVDYLYA